MLQVKVVSSLEKIFADEELKTTTWDQGSMFSNEVYSFQVAYHWNARMIKNAKVLINSELSPWITVHKVGLVPSEMPCYGDHDEHILRNTPGLYPDPLYPIDQEGLTLLPHQWRSLWLTIDPASQIQSGLYPIEIIFENSEGEQLGKTEFQIKIIDQSLPKQKLIHTEWFHTDCLATWYDVEVFSEEHWMRIKQFLQTAVKNGINMILTPLFTPPLDTLVGGERPTVQLVDVEKKGDQYQFGFNQLKRWIDLCQTQGVEYFEFSHLFTQWGAKHAPKIVVKENGEFKQIFGWDTDAVGEEYKNFLDQFLPALILFIKEQGIEKNSYFHVSDEPYLDHLESYKGASEILKKHLQDFPIIDALSKYQFYETGLVKNPIPANNHIEDFLENEVPNLWTYYCCSQYKDVSNRFFNMESARNRIIGIQLYKFNIVGFLHWGYNFWYSQYSRYPINPFTVTDAGHAFPSGDAFLVYPSEEGPIESLRLKVFFEALQDLRALQLLETFIGREEVIKFIEKDLEQPITFSEYPRDAQWLLLKREEINQKIADYIAKIS
ncbi:MAG: DUF4091 domain-containing protein [Epulopiscium sp.]|nr:DUF4091 domain-containing protein [Candidatus Epulonipiscium sp.]